jgi:ERCC4-type nuclease
MIIKVDSREKTLIAELNKLITAAMTIEISSENKKQNNKKQSKLLKEIPQLIVCQLPIGDVIICDEKELDIDTNEQKELLIIERKTIQDLSSSIRDGRYEEQSYRLSNLPIENHNIVYLIEGVMNKYTPPNIHSALFSIMYYKGFSVMQTNDTESSAYKIYNISIKMQKEKNAKNKTPYYSFTNKNKPEEQEKQKQEQEKQKQEQEKQKQDKPQEKDKPEEQEKKKSEEQEKPEEQEQDKPEEQEQEKPEEQEQEKPEEQEQDKPEEIEEENDELIMSNSDGYCSVMKKIKKNNVTRENIGEIMLCQIPSINSTIAISIINKYGTIDNLINTIKTNINELNSLKYKNKSNKDIKIPHTVISNLIKYLG